MPEARAAARIKSEHVARVYDVGSLDDGTPFIVMEFLDGRDLFDIVTQDGPQPVRLAVDYMLQACEALADAHSCGIVHRDIKPENLFLLHRSEGIELIKILDFGISKLALTGSAFKSNVPLVKTMLPVGSPVYMSPEQIQGETGDARSDLYSLGVTFYEVVTGQRPFHGENDYAIMQAHFAGSPVAPAERNSAIPRALSALILKAISRAPELRFQTAEEFAAALADSAATLVSSVASAPQPAPAFDPAELARLESHLRPTLGPIARHIVTKTARECFTLEQLRQRLAEQIPETQQRDAFLRRCQTPSATTPLPGFATSSPASRGTQPSGVVWDPGEIEKLKQRLAACLGPIARHLVDQQARRARTVQDLYQALAAEIPSERDRRAFLDTLPR